MPEQTAIVPHQRQALARAESLAASRELQAYTPPSAPIPSHTTASAPATQEMDISIADLFSYLRRYGRIGLLLAIPLAAAVLYYLGFGPKIYEAESKMLIDIENTGMIDFGEKGGTHLSELSAPMLINNHRTQLKTRKFTDFLYTKLTTQERESYLANAGKLGLRGRLTLALGLSTPPKAAVPGDLFAALVEKAVRVEPLKDSHIIRIQVRDNDPHLAASLANHYVKDYIDYIASEAVTGKRSAAAYLKQKSDELRTKLELAQNKLTDYRKATNLLKDSNATDLSTERADTMAKAVTEAEVALIRARIDLDLLHRLQGGGLDITQVKAVAEDPRINALRKDMDIVESERLTLAQVCGPKHPKIIAATSKITSLTSEQNNRVLAIVATAENEEARLRSQYEEMLNQLKIARDEDSKHIEQTFLRDEATSDRELYNQVLLRMKQANLSGDFTGAAGLGVSDIAVPPEVPISPIKSIALITSFLTFSLVGLGLPIGLGLTHDHLIPLVKNSQRTSPPVRAPNDTPNYQAQPPPTQPGPATLRPALATSQTPILATIPELMSADGAMQLGELLHPSATPSGNAIGQLAATLTRHAANRQHPGIVLLTSANASEGKSLVASGLAAALCTGGHRVFLMECNPASPCIQNWFPQADNYSSWTDDLESLRYGQSNLFLFPAHDLPSYEMCDLIQGYRAWIARAQPQVDWIILDGASLLRGFADIAQLAPLATDVLFIHDATRATSEQVRAALNLLRPLIAPDAMRGLVLNRES